MTALRRILVIRHSEIDQPGAFGRVMEEAGIAWHPLDPWQGEPMPTLEDYDAVLAMGGPQQADEEHLYPWLAHEKALLRDAVARGMPVLGVCLGCQLLADAHGGTVAALPEGEVGILDFSLAEGYETLVGERGVSLSGGQKQRVAIARTALLHPAVLVFDDSTAAIDAATESQIREALAERAEDTARIVVSHRLAAIRDADEILVLEAGRVIERGTHETLIARGGNYARIFALQARESLDGGLQGAAE